MAVSGTTGAAATLLDTVDDGMDMSSRSDDDAVSRSTSPSSSLSPRTLVREHHDPTEPWAVQLLPEGLRETVDSVERNMIRDCRLIRPIFIACKRVYRLLADNGDIQSDSFDPLSFFCQLDSDWVASYVSQNSDMMQLEVAMATMKDPKAPYQLLECLTDLSMNMKMLDPWAMRAIAKIFLDSEKIPSCLENFKADGGLNDDGSLNWENGPYRIIRDDDGRITTIQFGSNKAHKVDVALEFGKNAKLMRGWSVEQAFIRDPQL